MKVAIKAIPADPRDRIKGGGAKYAVREVRDHVQGNCFVLRTDVKSFYVSIPESIPEVCGVSFQASPEAKLSRPRSWLRVMSIWMPMFALPSIDAQETIEIERNGAGHAAR
jgi:hypothetical protein